MKPVWLLSILLAVALVPECSGYRILGVFPINVKSHNIVFEALMKGLVKRGHQVDVITHFPSSKPEKNYTVVVNLEGSLMKIMNNYTIDLVKSRTGDIVPSMVRNFGNRVCDFMGFDSMQKLIKNPPRDPPYDAVIVEAFTANCYLGLGYIFKVPVIAISSASEYPWISEITGNSDNLAIVPNAFHVGIGKMTYWERLKNVVSNHLELRKFYALTDKYQTDAMRKYLSPDMPSIREVEKNVALTLVNNDPVIFGVKPVVPTLVQIAGLHIEENDETLTPELKKWMDESKHGVVYLTLGSMVLVESLPAEQLKEIYASFEKIAPIRVLMKVVDKTKLPPGLPANVKVLPWIPQIPLLAHPNTRIFITHGGLGGLQEALYHGVPMIGMPLYADQFSNCEAFVAKDMMIRVDFDKLSGDALDAALDKMIHNPMYKEKVMYYSKIFKDRPISKLDNAAFWIEYVVRNGQVLRPVALDFTWWQLNLLDVYALLALVFVVSLLMIVMSVKLIINYFYSKLTMIIGVLIENFSSSEKMLKKSQ